MTELGKAGGVWCPSWVKGRGCAVYDDRPHSCRVFECGWLTGAYPEHWHPLRCKMVIAYQPDGDVLQIYVDPSNRNGWEKEPWRGDIERLAKAGKGKYRTEIRLFAPERIIEVRNG